MSERNAQRLRVGTVSPVGIVFMVVATAAPLTAMATALPLVVGLGNGVGAPGTYLLVALVLALFAVGYAAMSAHMTNAGAFYAYIDRRPRPAARDGCGPGRGPRLQRADDLHRRAGRLLRQPDLRRRARRRTRPGGCFRGVGLGIAFGLGILGIELNVRVLGVPADRRDQPADGLRRRDRWCATARRSCRPSRSARRRSSPARRASRCCSP